ALCPVSLLALLVVLLHVDPVALGIQQPVQLLALLGAEAAAAAAILRLELVDPRLLAFEARGFLRGQRAVFDSFRDAMLLPRFALVDVLRQRGRARQREADRHDGGEASDLHDPSVRSGASTLLDRAEGPR